MPFPKSSLSWALMGDVNISYINEGSVSRKISPCLQTFDPKNPIFFLSDFELEFDGTKDLTIKFFCDHNRQT